MSGPSIKIFTTGGTIDTIYVGAKGEYHVGEPQVTGILNEALVTFDYDLVSLFKKESLEITDEDRAMIRDAVIEAPEKRILITHGTDTMVTTGRALQGIDDKTIVITGAMQPACFRVTDANFNLGLAACALQTLPPGVYIAMSGRIFDPMKARKNVAECRFEDL